MATILVTGGAKRLGKAIVLHLAAAGYHIVLHYHHSRQEAVSTAAEAEALGVEVTLTSCDLGDPEGLDPWLASLPAVDGIVHNASLYPESTLATAQHDEFAMLMNLHAWSFVALTRHLQNQAKPIASIVMLDTRIGTPDPKHFNYQVSKQAAAALVQNLAREVAPVRVGGIAPGPVLPSTTAPESFQAGVDQTVLAKAVSLHSIAEAVHYLLTAEHTTGDILYVDSGRHLR